MASYQSPEYSPNLVAVIGHTQVASRYSAINLAYGRIDLIPSGP